MDNGIMAAPDTQLTASPSDRMSDYGSDIGFEDLDDATVWAELDRTTPDKSTIKNAVLPSIEFEGGELEDEEQDEDGYVQIHRPAVLRVAPGPLQSAALRERNSLEVEYDQLSRRAWSVPVQDAANPLKPSRSRNKSIIREATGLPSSQPPNVHAYGTDSPLERFRTKPKKCLSVTDLVSPAWCELQYFYTLSKFGRKPQTQAMRTGSKIHKQLEDQVHTTVPVQVQSKEDRFGLRIWNAISGVRCLRETGLTRELEVWGIVEGEVVNGVIDELSYQCPDPDFEQHMERSRAEKNGGIVPLPQGQPSIRNSFAKPTGSHEDPTAWLGGKEADRQIYLADVKTRSVNSLPVGPSLRPTWMQLMLYRKLLESLSMNTVDAETVMTRYDLQPLEAFTNVFMQEVDSIGPGNQVSNYPNLLSLWSLLISEMQITFPLTSLSLLLRAEFRYAKSGNLIGSELIAYDANVIDSYVREEMAWWKGNRNAKGVEIEEAFKCRICDFSEHCSWRITKVEEAIEKSRLRRQAREQSTV